MIKCTKCGQEKENLKRARCRKCETEGRRKYKKTSGPSGKSTPEQCRRRELKRKYGLSIPEYGAMLLEQRGVCAICGNPETMVRRGKLQPLSVDHDHVSGQPRGLLCQKCNSGIGFFDDDRVLFENARRYLTLYAK